MTLCKDRKWRKKSGKYDQRTNIIAGLVSNNVIALMVFNGSGNTKVFETWVEQVLIKELISDQVVMDNASFHKSEKIKALMESASCQLIFLLPYSPDLNLIEKFWADMKRWIKNKTEDIGQLYQSIQKFFVIPYSM
jgi:transposase